MDVANDPTVLVHPLGCRVVVNSWIDKEPGIEVVDLEIDVKIRIRRNVLAWGWADDDARDHLIKSRNVTHSYCVSIVVTQLGHQAYELDYTIHPCFASRL